MKTLLIIVGLIVILLLGYSFIAGTDADVQADNETNTVAAEITIDPALQAEYERLEANVQAGIEGAETELVVFVNNVEANARAAGAEVEAAYASFIANAREFMAGFDAPDVDVDVDVEVNESEDGDSTATSS